MTTITPLQVPVPDEDLCHLVWRAPAWLGEHSSPHSASSSTFGVTAQNALTYFCLSPFFDRRSTNQTLRMQTMFSGQPPMEPAAEAEALTRFVGVEYALVGAKDGEEGVFVIEKRNRESPTIIHPIATYMIIRGSIYQSPNLHSVLATRLRTSILAIQDMLDLARSVKPPYDPHHGYAWRIKSKPSEQAAQAAATAEGTALPVEGTALPSAAEKAEDAMDIDTPSLPPTTEVPPEASTSKARKAAAMAPSDAFNPLLSRALDATWASLTAPPAPPAPAPAPPSQPSRARTQTPSVAPATPRAPSQPPGPAQSTASKSTTPTAGTATAKGDGTKPAAVYRIGPTGKRKPARAA